MLIATIAIFAVTAFGGVVLGSHVLRDRFAPWALSLGHALLGASGLSALIWMLVRTQGTHQTLMLSLVFFAIAALGGFTLAGFHLTGRLPPKGSVLAHASVAVLGFLVLISIVFL